MSLRVLAKNTIVNGLSLLLRICVSYLLTPFLILHLGKEQYGVWMVLATFTLTGSLSFFSFGFQGALIKYVAEYHALGKLRQLNEAFSATVAFYLLTSLLCGSGVALFAAFGLEGAFRIPPDQLASARAVLFIFSLLVVFELPGMAVSAVIEGLQRYDLLALLDISRLLAFVVAAVAVVLSGHGILHLALAMLATSGAYVCGMALTAKFVLPGWGLAWGVDRGTLRDLLRFTGQLVIIRINSLIYNSMDKLIIGAMLGAALVTEYDIANRLHSLALTVMGLAPSVVIPAASAFDAVNDDERQRKLLLKGSKYTTAMTLPVVAALFVLAGPLITFWIAPQYSHVALYARLFLAYVFFWPVIQVGWNMLVGVNKVKEIIPLQVASVALNLFLTVVLVKRIGVAGTMAGTLIGNLLIFFAYIRLFSDTFHVTKSAFLRSVVVAPYTVTAVAAAGLCALVRIHPPTNLLEVVFFGAGTVALSYAAFATFGVDAEDRAAFASILGGLAARLRGGPAAGA